MRYQRRTFIVYEFWIRPLGYISPRACNNRTEKRLMAAAIAVRHNGEIVAGLIPENCGEVAAALRLHLIAINWMLKKSSR